MAGRTIEIDTILERDTVAEIVSNFWNQWNMQRSEKVAEWKELRNYIFATDTTTTTNSQLPWKNKTTIPKLTQLRDNLHANYLAALFPNDDWLKWEGHTEDAEDLTKRRAIQAYMSNKTRESDFRTTISQLLYDYIDYGNAFADVIYVNESKEDEDTGEVIQGYVGPKLVRTSPLDLVFNPTATSFEHSPKIRRYIKTIGELKLEAEENPDLRYDQDKINWAIENRNNMRQFDWGDTDRDDFYTIDGFGSLQEYYSSNYVEILELEGTIHNADGTLMKDRIITVIDRATVVRNIQNPSWLGGGYKRHVGWRLRPDNLYAMGPLDNLVGMQYRIDHLENLKADVFDIIAHPVLKIKGDVDEFTWGPGEEIYLGDDGDVTMLAPDTTALNADTQIALLEQRMEEMAGAPKQAMGIRTPGEKTAFEVQSLENAAGRIFQNKITHFEIKLVEPILNAMLEISRRNLNATDIIRVMDDDIGVAEFLSVSKEDITAKGKLRPVGARHFAAQAQMVQNLTGLANTPMWQMIQPHISSKALAKAVEDLLGFERFDIIRDNVFIVEQAETQRLMNQMQEDMEVEQGVSAEPKVGEEF